MMKFTEIIGKLLSVSFLEILTVEVCFSSGRQNRDYNYCNDRGTEKRYFVGSTNGLSWDLANQICQSKNSFLPVIQNKDQQMAFERYLECLRSNGPRIHSVWTSGKRETYTNWRWINGEPLSNAQTIVSNSDTSKTQVALRTRFLLTAENPLNHGWYLCQHKDHQCNGENQFQLTNGCFIPSGRGNTSWFESRNECLSKGGDLAVLTDQDLQRLENHTFPNNNYWIGLRKVNWIWKTNTAKKEEVKYTKWARQTHPTSGELCISINTANGQWTASECNITMSVVCEKHVSANGTTGATESTKPPSALIIGVTSVGVVIIIVCIIVILIVLRRKSKSSMEISVSGRDNTEEAQYQALQRNQIYENDVDNYTMLTLQPMQ